MPSIPQDEPQVLVVGGGPVGLLTAYTLAYYGTRCLLVERNDSTTQWPKMDLTNVRSMEILARLGLADDMRKQGVPTSFSLDNLYSSGLGEGGQIIGRIDLPSPDQFREMIRDRNDGTMPREPYQRCSQANFEAWLRKIVEAQPLIESHWSTKLVTLVEEQDFVTSTLISGTEERTVKTKYVVGCDGAGSRVRTSVGINLTGTPMPFKVLLVHFKSRDLTRIQAQGQFWHYFPANGGIMIAQDEVDTWTVHLPMLLDADTSNIDAEQAVYNTLGAYTGPYPINIDKIIVKSVWKPNTALADQYRSPNGRVFLAGDSAHQNIPSGGYGMNTGLGDAFDIGWKLALFLNGVGGSLLIDSYESERRPVAEHNVHRAAFHSSNHRGWAEMVEKAGADILLSQGEEGKKVRSQIQAHISSHSNVNKERGTEMDYRIRPSAVVALEKDAVEPPFEHLQYTPSTLPGSRAPHVFLRDGKTSIFDLYGRAYTVVDFSPNGSLSSLLLKQAEMSNVPMTRVHLPEEREVQRIWERDVVLVRPDGFVGWRSGSGTENYTQGFVERVLLVVTGQKSSKSLL